DRGRGPLPHVATPPVAGPGRVEAGDGAICGAVTLRAALERVVQEGNVRGVIREWLSAGTAAVGAVRRSEVRDKQIVLDQYVAYRLEIAVHRQVRRATAAHRSRFGVTRERAVDNSRSLAGPDRAGVPAVGDLDAMHPGIPDLTVATAVHTAVAAGD